MLRQKERRLVFISARKASEVNLFDEIIRLCAQKVLCCFGWLKMMIANR